MCREGLEPAVCLEYHDAMLEPSPRGSRIAIASAVVSLLIAGGGGFLLGRGTTEPMPVSTVPVAEQPDSKPTSEATSSGLLDRSDLIALASAAADAAAAGRDPGIEVNQADGRRFELRMPFGCDGPADEDSTVAMRWRYDVQDQALRLHVDPVIWTGQDWWPDDAATDVETIEGFWITRPWTSSEACPAGRNRPTALGTEPVTLPGQTLALGQIFFTEGARRGRRNGEPFETTLRIPEDELATSEGFQLRIRGRLTRTRGYGPVQCKQPAGPEQRPICLLGVVVDEVAIENPTSKKTLATWSIDGLNSLDI
ncbi:MAG: hypothetical protein ACXIUO_09120 [Erythrobacter sp.]